MGMFERLFGKKKAVEAEPAPPPAAPSPDVSRAAAEPPTPPPDTPELWAQALKQQKDYRALAAINNSQDYSKGFNKWRKRDLANRILREAGAEAVDAILAELDTDGVGGIDLATLLVDIGDPKAVPLLKRKLDRGDFSAYGSQYRIRDFVGEHPELHGAVETVECALCGKSRPVADMRGGGDTYFCTDTCWPKRGRVLAHGTGTDCPFYAEGMCTAGEGDSLCSLGSGSYASSCYVYAMHKGTAGMRSCALCGAQWRSTYGAMKDLALFGPQAHVSATYDPENLLGLVCTQCGKSFCKRCLSGKIPTSLPGGSCPQCGGKLSLA
jgi:hypothetical protein